MRSFVHASSSARPTTSKLTGSGAGSSGGTAVVGVGGGGEALVGRSRLVEGGSGEAAYTETEKGGVSDAGRRRIIAEKGSPGVQAPWLQTL